MGWAPSTLRVRGGRRSGAGAAEWGGQKASARARGCADHDLCFTRVSMPQRRHRDARAEVEVLPPVHVPHLSTRIPGRHRIHVSSESRHVAARR